MSGAAETRGRPEDRGLQAERTTLSWTRTLVALIAVAAFSIRIGDRVPLLAAIVVPLALVAAVSQVLAARRRHSASLRALVEGKARPALIAVLAVSAATAALGFACLVLALLEA